MKVWWKAENVSSFCTNRIPVVFSYATSTDILIMKSYFNGRSIVSHHWCDMIESVNVFIKAWFIHIIIRLMNESSFNSRAKDWESGQLVFLKHMIDLTDFVIIANESRAESRASMLYLKIITSTLKMTRNLFPTQN